MPLTFAEADLVILLEPITALAVEGERVEYRGAMSGVRRACSRLATASTSACGSNMR